MAWRIDQFVLAGELDNTQVGWTIGWLELSGVSQRLNLKLSGNCNPDLAGWKFRIKRVGPELESDYDGEDLQTHKTISSDQSGNVGNISADRLVKHFDISVPQLIQQINNGETPPFTWRKCLYMEWYSNKNGRIVVESTLLEVERLGERAFTLTDEQCREQQLQSEQEFGYFLNQVGDALEQQEKPE